jgi:hypothetical protein
VITEAEMPIEDVFGARPEEGTRLLYLWFEGSGGDAVDVDVIFDTLDSVYVLNEDGSRSSCAVVGSIDGQLFVYFLVPADSNTFTVHWYDNPPFTLTVSQ